MLNLLNGYDEVIGQAIQARDYVDGKLKGEVLQRRFVLHGNMLAYSQKGDLYYYTSSAGDLRLVKTSLVVMAPIGEDELVYYIDFGDEDGVEVYGRLEDIPPAYMDGDAPADGVESCSLRLLRVAAGMEENRRTLAFRAFLERERRVQ